MNDRESAEFVKDARDRLAMTQEGFAAEIGVSRQTIYRYEAGDYLPPSMRLAIERLLQIKRK
jgi:DNA-binding XRE family transcriptional regulator